MPHEQADVARVTYRHLRWLMVLLPAVLFVVTVVTAIQQMELEPSISDYYGGPVRDVFVGVMIATAACMIAYQGASLLEDYTLNGAGFYAVFVALVPTNLNETLSALRANPTPDGVTPADYVWFLRTALTTVLVLCALLLWIELRRTEPLTRLWTTGTWNLLFVVVTSLVLLAFLVVAMAQLWVPDPDDVTMGGLALGPVRLRVHDLAAILLIAALAVAVWSHAWPTVVTGHEVHATDLEVAAGYKTIFGLMLVGPLVAVLVHAFVAPDHTVIFLEWWEIVLFCVFWILETRRVAKVRSATARGESAGSC